ncbi:MAG: transglutaminase family protein [Chitinophagaceae bacterium]|nr:MAG: transglutaminase family protein [Chitinophagaceae bacterium]
MPVFNIHHITRYEYDRPIKESVNEIRIYPYVCREQEALYHQLNITGSPEVFQQKDYWGNLTGMFNLMPAHRELVIESKLIVRTLGVQPAWDQPSTSEDLRLAVADNLNLLELARSSEPELEQRLAVEVANFFQPGQTVASIVSACAGYIYREFQYLKGITSVETTVAEILEIRSGVCQDFAHLMLELLRQIDIPCRYVSGYICPNKNGMRGEGATHAWVEAWIPGSGWAGIDPTNNVWVTDTHVKLAVGRNFGDCTPVKGTFRGLARQSLSVYVSVGYEDGQTIEDINKVKLGGTPGGEEIPEYIDQEDQQQQ